MNSHPSIEISTECYVKAIKEIEKIMRVKAMETLEKIINSQSKNWMGKKWPIQMS